MATATPAERVTVNAEVGIVMDDQVFTITDSGSSSGVNEILVVSADPATIGANRAVRITGTLKEVSRIEAVEEQTGIGLDDSHPFFADWNDRLSPNWGDWGKERYLHAVDVDTPGSGNEGHAGLPHRPAQSVGARPGQHGGLPADATSSSTGPAAPRW